MTGRGRLGSPGPLDRAAVVLGVVSVLSVGFRYVTGDLEFVHIRGWGFGVALVLGVLTVAAGLVAHRLAQLVAGGLFLVAATVLLVQIGTGGGFLEGNGSTFSLWLGLGAGLVAVGLAKR